MNRHQTLKAYLLSFIIIISTVSIACGNSNGGGTEPGPGPGPTPPNPGPVINVTPNSLTKIDDQSILVSDFAQNLTKQSNTSLDYYLDYDCSPVYYDDIVMSSPISSNDTGQQSAPTNSGAATEESDFGFTDTNVQEQGVDEADLIKTNGKSLFVATYTGIDIFKAWPLVEFEKLTTYQTDHPVSALYLVNDQLITLSNTYHKSKSQKNDTQLKYSKRITRVEFIDISNPAKPILKRVKEIEGYYNNSRLVDGILHMVIPTYAHSTIKLETPDYSKLYKLACSENSSDQDELKKLIQEYKDKNEQIIQNITLADFLPWQGDGDNFAPIQTQVLDVEHVSFYSENDSKFTNLLGLISLDIDEARNEFYTYISGHAYQIYASKESIYLSNFDYHNQATRIHKFDIQSSDKLNDYVSSGAVAGYVNDQFSMSEYNDYFRIATTVGNIGSSDSYNNVYILDATKDGLPLVGAIENIAKTETIYAARFMGNRGYLVTFEKVDPFFVLDLTDPTNPSIEGELKMPGYSSYLHLLNEDYVIGLGKDAEDAGNFSWFQGLKLATFDVTNTSQPEIADERIIGGRNTESAALYDSHAFTFDRSSGLLALPLSYCEAGNGGSSIGQFRYNGVHLYGIDENGIIDDQGIIKLPNTSTEPLRTIIVGDNDQRGLYVIENQKIYLYDLNKNLNRINTLNLSNSFGLGNNLSNFWGCGNNWD
ncbi:hypothetical protein BVY03_00155 [bacterium K02(2017)]|nr:hypothetical protein BVY03_00155 [bacterium K02(2017)]